MNDTAYFKLTIMIENELSSQIMEYYRVREPEYLVETSLIRGFSTRQDVVLKFSAFRTHDKTISRRYTKEQMGPERWAELLQRLGKGPLVKE